MNNGFDHTAEQAAAFQKLWLQSASKMLQATLSMSPNAEPEGLRQMRSAIFQALGQSWDEFMRSPQFLESMKQWTEGAVSLRKMSGEFLARMRNEMQAPSRDDVDTILLAIRHLETRVLDRIDSLSEQINNLSPQQKKPLTAPSQRRARRASASAGRSETRVKEAL